MLGIWVDGKFTDVLASERWMASMPVNDAFCDEKSKKLRKQWLEFHVLMEPHAAVHAYSGVLPVCEIRLPGASLEAAFANMAVPFRVGPLLYRKKNGATPEERVITLPHPASSQGDWTWQEKSAERSWREYALGSLPSGDEEITISHGLFWQKNRNENRSQDTGKGRE